MKQRNEIGTRLGALLLASSLLSTAASAAGSSDDNGELDALSPQPLTQTMTLTAFIQKNEPTSLTEIPQGDGDEVDIFDIDGNGTAQEDSSTDGEDILDSQTDHPDNTTPDAEDAQTDDTDSDTEDDQADDTDSNDEDDEGNQANQSDDTTPDTADESSTDKADSTPDTQESTPETDPVD